MRRGEVYLGDLEPRSGSEQRGRRPMVVLSNDGFNSVPSWLSVIVVPISTSHGQALRGPTVVGLPRGTAGLLKDSVALCHQVTTLDRRKLTSLLGRMPTDRLREIEQGVMDAMDLPRGSAGPPASA